MPRTYGIGLDGMNKQQGSEILRMRISEAIRLMKKAENQVKLGNYDEAVDLYTDCMSVLQLPAMVGRAQGLQYAERTIDAEIDLYRAVRINAAKSGRQIRKGSCRFGKHQFELWLWNSPDACDQYGLCENCGKKAQRMHHANWTQISFDPIESDRRCNRCGERRIKNWQGSY